MLNWKGNRGQGNEGIQKEKQTKLLQMKRGRGIEGRIREWGRGRRGVEITHVLVQSPYEENDHYICLKCAKKLN